MRCIELLDKRKSHGGDRKSEEIKTSSEVLKANSAAETAKIVGTSQSIPGQGRFHPSNQPTRSIQSRVIVDAFSVGCWESRCPVRLSTIVDISPHHLIQPLQPAPILGS